MTKFTAEDFDARADWCLTQDHFNVYAIRANHQQESYMLRQAAEQARELATKQAQIDALMLEFCPGEMTEEQRSEWAKHQQRVSPEREAEIDAAIKEKQPCDLTK